MFREQAFEYVINFSQSALHYGHLTTQTLKIRNPNKCKEEKTYTDFELHLITSFVDNGQSQSKSGTLKTFNTLNN